MALSVKVNIDFDAITNRIASPELMLYTHERLRAYCNDYVPCREGNLSGDVRVSSACVHYIAPYAEYIYNGKKFNFSKDKHELATAEWDKAAMITRKDSLVADIQAAIERGL